MPYKDPEKRKAYQKQYGRLYYLGKRGGLGLRGSKESFERMSAAQKARFAEIKIIPTCHPDRKHGGKGLCGPCYQKSVYDPVEGLRKHLKRRYNVTPEQVDQMKIDQSFLCALCKTVPQKWCVDHDHTTGKVRGMLCGPCNVLLGGYEKMKKIEGINEYLEKGK